jgi:hypothetical protein
LNVVAHTAKVGQNDTFQTDSKLISDPILIELTALLRHWNGSGNLPADLKHLISVWPKLPEHIKAAVLALVGTVKL